MKSLIFPIILLIFGITSCTDNDIDPNKKNNPNSDKKINNPNGDPVVSTFVGSDKGDHDGKGEEVKINSPNHITVSKENTIYFTDGENFKIKRISPEGIVTTIAGSSKGYKDGSSFEAQFTAPWGIALATNGNMYISDANRIRKISPEGEVTTIAGNGNKGYRNGPGNEAEFNSPGGLALAADGTLYVADMYNHKIRKIDVDGIVSTVAGGEEGFKDGNSSEAQFNLPSGLAIDEDGNIFVADSHNHRIRIISSQRVVLTFAGDGENLIGSAPDAILVAPMDLTINSDGDLFAADTRGLVIKINGKNGDVEWYAGSNEYGFVNGLAADARFNFISGLEVAPDGSVYVCDPWQHLIRKISKE